MEPIFYDKESIKIDKQLETVNKQANRLQANVPVDSRHLAQARNAFAAHHDKIDERITALSKEEVKGGKFRTVAGVTVGLLLAWEVFQGAKGVFSWLSRKMQQETQAEREEQKITRRHARDWTENNSYSDW